MNKLDCKDKGLLLAITMYFIGIINAYLIWGIK
jgi:hypothetical protein